MAGYRGGTVIVTGASRGIGLAVAQQYAAMGAPVGLVAHGSERLQALAADWSGPCHWVAADLADPAECRRAVTEIEASLGAIEVLISCAGVLRRDFVEDVSESDFEDSYRLNAGAAIWLSQSVLPGMRERRRGTIVFVSSELGLIGGPTYASYSTSKWALVGLAEVMHHELKGTGVRVCAVCPGDVRTDQLVEEHEWGPTGGEAVEKAMTPEYAAKAIVRAAASSAPVVVIDRPHLRLAFNLMGGPRRLRLAVVGSAFTTLMRERGPRASATPRANADDDRL